MSLFLPSDTHCRADGTPARLPRWSEIFQWTRRNGCRSRRRCTWILRPAEPPLYLLPHGNRDKDMAGIVMLSPGVSLTRVPAGTVYVRPSLCTVTSVSANCPSSVELYTVIRTFPPPRLIMSSILFQWKCMGAYLAFIDHQKLFRIGLRISVVFCISVPDSDQGKTDLVKFTQSIICNIPSQHVVADLVIFVILCLPLLRRPAAERRSLKSVFF